MAHQFSMTRRVEFSETDMAGIAHFANFFRWMESCEHDFMRSLGLGVHGALSGELAGREYGFARVHASCDYRRPVRFEQLMRIELTVQAKSAKGFEYGFNFHLEGESAVDTPPLAMSPFATGCLKVVCVSLDPAAGRPRAVDIPPAIAALVEPAP